ncbi:MAG: type IV pilus assembly protein PilM [Candidatus Sumerlaeia bacterium]|nr:type IV pilus assembly protein PilM [Candidatus Sumerlaeia bacterium]
MFGEKSAIGLDVGSAFVKAVQLRRAGKSLIVDKIGIADIYPEGDKNVSPEKDRMLKVDAIKRALQNGKIKAKYAITGLSGESIIVRYIQMPSMPEDELKNAVRYAAEEYIPYSIDEVNIDAVVLGKTATESGEEVDVLLVSARKELVEERTEILKEAGLIPITIDLASFAFVNCYEVNYQPSMEDVIALVNIGAGITSINIYHSGTSRFSRDIAIAGDSITSALQSRMGISFLDAEQLKITVGLPLEEPRLAETRQAEGSLLDTIRGTIEKLTPEEFGEDSTEANAARLIRNSVNNIITEVKRSIQFFENQPKGKPVKKLVLGGGTARLKGLAEYFKQQINLPTEVINPFLRFTINKDISPSFIEQNKESLAVGIGLALRKVVD